jgi:hypothetical protein
MGGNLKVAVFARSDMMARQRGHDAEKRQYAGKSALEGKELIPVLVMVKMIVFLRDEFRVMPLR